MKSDIAASVLEELRPVLEPFGQGGAAALARTLEDHLTTVLSNHQLDLTSTIEEILPEVMQQVSSVAIRLNEIVSHSDGTLQEISNKLDALNLLTKSVALQNFNLSEGFGALNDSLDAISHKSRYCVRKTEQAASSLNERFTRLEEMVRKDIESRMQTYEQYQQYLQEKQKYTLGGYARRLVGYSLSANLSSAPSALWLDGPLEAGTGFPLLLIQWLTGQQVWTLQGGIGTVLKRMSFFVLYVTWRTCWLLCSHVVASLVIIIALICRTLRALRTAFRTCTATQVTNRIRDQTLQHSEPEHSQSHRRRQRHNHFQNRRNASRQQRLKAWFREQEEDTVDSEEEIEALTDFHSEYRSSSDSLSAINFPTFDAERSSFQPSTHALPREARPASPGNPFARRPGGIKSEEHTEP
ncbi:unnamed protein product [Sympodiomycopsis kandeliae]